MTSWWHPQHPSHAHHHPMNESYDYPPVPSAPSSMIPNQYLPYDTNMLMIENPTQEEYLMHGNNHLNLSENTSIDYHPRRHWFNGSNNDDRKAKSRVAAKHRRSAENKEFTDLSKLLPLQQQIAAQLDKASIIRLTISYLRLHEFLSQGDPSWPSEINVQSRKQAFKLFNADEASQLLQSLDGFIFALSSDGRILYISESVSSSLGLSMVEMTGNFIFNYLHDDDKKVFADALGFELVPPSSPTTSLSMDMINAGSGDPDLLDLPPDQCPRMQAPTDHTRFQKKSICVRMKSSLTKRAPNMKTPGYRSIQIIGEYRWLHPDHRRTSHNGDHLLGFVGTALIPHLSPSQNEYPIPEHQNVIRLDEHLRITNMDEKLQRTLNWNLTYPNSSLYLYVHPDDLSSLVTLHRDLPLRQQLVLNLIRFQMNIVLPSTQHGRKSNANPPNPIVVEQKWIYCDLLATMMQSKSNDENFVILVVEIIGVDEGRVAPMIDEELENEYATRVPYRAQLSPDDVVESSPPTSNASTRLKQQRQHSPYPPSDPASFYPSSSPSSRHLASTSNSSPSSPHDSLSSARPSVIMSKGLSTHSNSSSTHLYQPYVQYECPTFAQQQYSMNGPSAEHWYYHPAPPSSHPSSFSSYHHPSS